jgi:hypothetical protein
MTGPEFDDKINATLAAMANRAIEHLPEAMRDQLRASLRDGDYGFLAEGEWIVVVIGGHKAFGVSAYLLGLTD